MAQSGSVIIFISLTWALGGKVRGRWKETGRGSMRSSHISLLSVYLYICVHPYMCVMCMYAPHLHTCVHPCICLCALGVCACICVHAVHACVEAEKFQNLLSATCRTRKASDVIQSKSEGPRTRSSEVQGTGYKVQGTRYEDSGRPRSYREQISPFPCLLFYWSPQ